MHQIIPRPSFATIADNNPTAAPQNSNFSRQPKKTITFSLGTKGMFEIAVFVKDLKKLTFPLLCCFD